VDGDSTAATYDSKTDAEEMMRASMMCRDLLSRGSHLDEFSPLAITFDRQIFDEKPQLLVSKFISEVSPRLVPFWLTPCMPLSADGGGDQLTGPRQPLYDHSAGWARLVIIYPPLDPSLK
jgi:hypothetical protein